MNRSAFYLYYETLNDLLNESVQYMLNQFLSHMKDHSIETELVTRLRDCPISDLYLITPKYLMPYLSYIEQNKHLFRHVFVPILERYQVPEQDRPLH